MKQEKSIFSKVILLIIIGLVCFIATVALALVLGSAGRTLFDFSNLNLANVLPVLVIGGFISCVIIGIGVLFLTRSVFFKVKDYIDENKK